MTLEATISNIDFITKYHFRQHGHLDYHWTTCRRGDRTLLEKLRLAKLYLAFISTQIFTASDQRHLCCFWRLIFVGDFPDLTIGSFGKYHTGAGTVLLCEGANGGRGSSGISLCFPTAGILHDVKVFHWSARAHTHSTIGNLLTRRDNIHRTPFSCALLGLAFFYVSCVDCQKPQSPLNL